MQTNQKSDASGEPVFEEDGVTPVMIRELVVTGHHDIFLTYVELSYLKRKRIVYSRLVNGNLSVEAAVEMAYDFMREMIVGWKGVCDEGGNAIMFQKGISDDFDEAIYTPFLDDVVSKFTKEFFTGDEVEESQEGN